MTRDCTKLEINSRKAWATLVADINYLPGVLTLEYCLRKNESKYPLVVLYTDSFPAEGHAALDARGLHKHSVPLLLPAADTNFGNNARFIDCWTKLTVFSLVEYERVVMLDSDMLIIRNMDELMDVDLDPPEMGVNGNRVIAASHECTCNPLKKKNHPKYWDPSNCSYTFQHTTPEIAQTVGPPAVGSLGGLNSGLLVVNPSLTTYDRMLRQLATPAVLDYAFADETLLSDVLADRWVPLPYIYNALKTLRWQGVHDAIWDDEKIKNIHYVSSPKPWDEMRSLQKEPGNVYEDQDPTHMWWIEYNQKRVDEDRDRGIHDDF